MSCEGTILSKCYTLDATYQFNTAESGDVTLNILDIFQQMLFSKTFSAEDLGRWKITRIFYEDPAQLLLEQLIARKQIPDSFCPSFATEVTSESCQSVLQQVISQLKPKTSIDEQTTESLTCPLTLEIFENPVIDKCGHTFEEAAIKESMKRKNECPLSRAPIRDLTPNLVVSSMIAELRERPPIPTFALFKKENPGLAKCNHQLAQACVKEGEYEDALEAYAKAFTYTKEWGYFANLPPLFELMEEWEKATYAYLLLAQHQLEDGAPAKAIQTLEACQQGKGCCFQIDIILTDLYCLEGELKRGVFVVNRIRESFQADRELGLRLARRITDIEKGIDKKRKMHRKAAPMCGAGAAVGGGLSAIRAVKETKKSEGVLEMAFGKAKWEKYFGIVGEEPPLPKDIEAILKSDCPYFPGKIVRDSHLLVLIPKTVNREPFTIKKLEKLIERPLTGFATEYGNDWHLRNPDLASKGVETSYWALMTKCEIHDSLNKNFTEQLALVKEGYTLPTMLEMITGIFTHHVQTGESPSEQRTTPYIRCQDLSVEDEEYRMVVQWYPEGGLSIYDRHDRDTDFDLGLACLRKF